MDIWGNAWRYPVMSFVFNFRNFLSVFVIVILFTQISESFWKLRAIFKKGSQKIIDHANRIIEISVIPNKELLTTILTYGNDIEVLSPEHIRNEIRAIIEDSLSKY